VVTASLASAKQFVCRSIVASGGYGNVKRCTVPLSVHEIVGSVRRRRGGVGASTCALPRAEPDATLD
jgi:hypothetical protein